MTWNPDIAKSELTEEYLRDLTTKFPVKVIPGKDEKSDTLYRLPVARLDYYDLFKAGAGDQDDPNSKPKFKATLVFPPWEELKPLRAAIMTLAKATWGDDLPDDLKFPLRKQKDKKDKDGYLSDGYFLNPNSPESKRPELIDRRTGQPITKETDLYRGCWVMASVTLYAYGKTPEERKKTKGARGITLQLKNVIKICDDLVLAGGGGPKAKDVYADLLSDTSSSKEDDTDYGDLM